MAEDFLAKFIGNPTRARLIRVFALNQSDVFTAAQAAKRAGVGRAAAMREVKALEKMGLVKKGKFSIIVQGKKKSAGKQKEQAWGYDVESRYAAALSRFVHEVSPVQYKKILNALKRSGRLSVVLLSGSFMGDPTRPADLIVAVDSLNEGRLESAVKELEREFGREVRYAAFSKSEFDYRLTTDDKLFRDTLEYPHFVLLDKAHLLQRFLA